MAEIKILNPSVYNMIAAGEVIERPCGVVKELVENSIDAGAQHITVEVVNGGFDLIAVTDDGCGIAEDDVEMAFVKHATSKITSALQLTAIDTLGFRGEALSSIAAVSRVTLTTRTAAAEAGVKVTLEDAAIVDKQYLAANKGTRFEVRDLFYNTPARRKFLKTPSSEGTEITKFVAKLILTNPTLEITYIADGKTMYTTKGEGLEEAIFSIYGAEYLKNCLKVNYQDDLLKITGYIGTPDNCKANRNNQILSVNNRVISDLKIASSIGQAYQSYLMTHKFPVFVLDLFIPCDLVDVNVHPKKSEVRFADQHKVCAAFYIAVGRTLQHYSNSRVEDIFDLHHRGEETPAQKEAHQNVSEVISRLSDEGEIEYMTPDQRATIRKIEYATKASDAIVLTRDELAAYWDRPIDIQKIREETGLDDPHYGIFELSHSDDEDRDEGILRQDAYAGPEPTEEELLLERTHILGTAFKTYLILQLDDKVIFVDQHAAHERILYEKFMQLANMKKAMQQLAVPYVFNVSPDEGQFLKDNAETIYTAGIEIEEFGENTFRITSVSTLISDMKMSKFVEYLLSYVDECRVDDKALLAENIAKRACKAAIKAGTTLDKYEIQWILKEVVDNQITQCPHGRPITYIITQAELEKKFKRVL